MTMRYRIRVANDGADPRMTWYYVEREGSVPSFWSGMPQAGWATVKACMSETDARTHIADLLERVQIPRTSKYIYPDEETA